jgi:geranylgeranyl reductase family protein
MAVQDGTPKRHNASNGGADPHDVMPHDVMPHDVLPVDVLVIGAGPGGVAAALTAHEHGLDVVMIDRAVFPRDKACGDGLTALALRQLEQLGVEVPALPGYEPVREAVFVLPSGHRTVLPMPPTGTYSGVVPRLELDAAFVARARQAGIDVREGTELVGLTDTASGVRAGLGDETTLDARHVVAADGHWSRVRRLREPEAAADLGTWHAFRQYFRGVEERRQFILFERDLLPGYAWVFPLPDGRANVGFGVLRTAGVTGKKLKALWPDLLARPSMRKVLGPDAEPEDAHRAWPIPSSYDPNRLTDDRVLYVGDAASLVDPLTGEGIAEAIESGILAGRAIGAGGAPATIAAAYRRAIAKSLGRDLRLARTLRHVFSTPLGTRFAAHAAGLTPWTRRNFVRWLFEDYPRALLLTPDRWHRRMFTAPGAFQSGSSPTGSRTPGSRTPGS